MEELKSCPFCNGKSKVMVREKQFFGWRDNGVKVKSYFVYVACNKCRSRGKPIATNPSSVQAVDYYGRFSKWVKPYIEKAVDAWNRRADDGRETELQELRETIKAMKAWEHRVDKAR